MLYRRRRLLLLAQTAQTPPDPDPPAPPEWFDGGYPAGYSPRIQMPAQGVVTDAFTPATFNDDVLASMGPVCRAVLEPGTYKATGEYPDFYADDKIALHIVGLNAAWVDGAPNYDSGTLLSGFTSWENELVIFENLIFYDTSYLYDEQIAGPDYAIYTNREQYVQVKNCVFAGRYIHDLSFKRAQLLGEVLGNHFLESERHSVEVGQEVNYQSDPTQVVETVIRGNSFKGNKLHAVSINSAGLVTIHDNDFEDIAGRPVQTISLNTTSPANDLRLLTPPLRTEVTGNRFSGYFQPLWFRSRGLIDDTVLVKDNIGLTAEDLLFTAMDPLDAAAFADANDPVQTTAPPSLDPESDVVPPEPAEAPEVVSSTSGYTEDFTTTHTVTLPSGLQNGDRLFIFITIGASEDYIIPSGWDEVYWTTNQMTAMCLTREVDGTEGSTVSIVGDGAGARISTWVCVAVRGASYYEPDWQTGGDNPTTATNPELSPVPGSGEYLWLCTVHWRQGTRDTTPPSNFTTVQEIDSTFVGASDNHTHVAQRTYEAGTLQPGNWTSNQVDTELNNYITSLIAIR